MRLMPKATDYFLRNRWPWLTASILLTGLLFVSTTLGWYWYTEQRAAAARQLSLDLLWLEQSIAESLQGNKNILANWANDLPASAASKPASTAKALEEFSSRISGMMKENPALLSIDYLDKDGARLAGFPAYTERPERLPPLSDPLIDNAIRHSRDLDLSVYSQVIEQYAPLWVLVVPVKNEDERTGSLLATYDLDQLLSQKVPWWFVQRYDLSLLDRENKQLSPRDGSQDGGNSDTYTDIYKLAFGPMNSDLSLRASPHHRGQSKTLLAWLAVAVVLLGLLVIFLLRILQRWLRERQAVQHALAKELRFREAMEHSLATGLLAFDANASIIYANPALCKLLGLAQQSLLGYSAPYPFWPSLQTDSGVQCEQAHLAMLNGDNPANGRNLHFLHADGSLLSVRLFASPLVDGDGHPSGWMASLYDITAEQLAANMARERDELLQRSSRLASLAEFASGIAHELNQPLAAIANYSAAADCFLDSEPPAKHKVQEAVRRIGEESRRAGQIVHSMRSFIQRRSNSHTRHNLCDLLSEPMALLEPLLQRNQSKISIQLSETSILIECDAVMLEQVLFNLLRNAIEALAIQALATLPPAQSVQPIVLRIERELGDVIVSVIDHGPGIDDADKLFLAFYTTKAEGMGLGLAICRTVIESHGGRLWAEATPGGGASFKFRLPISTADFDEKCEPAN
jgi:two-component system sensor histidine kinase DctS